MIGVTRREMLHRVGAGMGALGLASVFSSPASETDHPLVHERRP